ncbi:omega-hydroxypalmitate O-feruloyl transferase-like [Papaver somniferum]|uniref:omega-hydroxypalmitate O-feruloyl transferase-like n=1 Tax=Papaver somniferum TaxID=3469 RepID=UPI000E702218|nr:omega-hydroxypalmitate O-feruloyl transferase-like [Papaver somniferum]
MSTEVPVCVYKSQPALIFPEKPTPKCPLYLSNTDNLNFLRHTKVEFMFVYRKSIPINNLKSSLSKVLFHYYPLAGRFRNCAEDEDRLEVDCNGKGALLAEGFMDFTADEFLDDNAWLDMAWKDKLLFKVDAKSDSDIPPLVIQVTYLSCGGMLMCIHMNHCITDGVGASKFLHDWAHLHAKPNMDLPISPVHNHGLTFEALAAHVWRCYIKALNLPSSLKIKLLFPAIIRTKIEPNLPKGYYGNSFIYACAKTTVKEIVTAKVNDIVKLIQNSKRRVLSNDYVRSMIDIIEEKNLQLAMSTTLAISDWRTLGIEKLDFGEGKPLHAGQLSSETWCLFLPQIGGCNAIKVLVSIPKKIVHKFEYYMMNDILQKDDELINGEFEFEGNNIKSRI